MNSIALTITLRPLIKEKLLKESKRRQMSMSRCIDELLEKHYEEDYEDYTYTLEELDRESERLDKEIALGISKPYTDVNEMIRALNS